MVFKVRTRRLVDLWYNAMRCKQLQHIKKKKPTCWKACSSTTVCIKNPEARNWLATQRRVYFSPDITHICIGLPIFMAHAARSLAFIATSAHILALAEMRF